MPNFKVHVTVSTMLENFKIHALDVYVEAPSILIAGNSVMNAINRGILVVEGDIDRIAEIESRPPKPKLNDECPQCGLVFREVPSLRYACRNQHITIRHENGIKSSP